MINAEIINGVTVMTVRPEKYDEKIVKYIKAVDNSVIVSISKTYLPGKGNMTEKEFSEVYALIKDIPEGKVLIETEKGYEYADPPEDPGKGDLTPDEAWKIIESSNISKENKQLLKDYIYKEG